MRFSLSGVASIRVIPSNFESRIRQAEERRDGATRRCAEARAALAAAEEERARWQEEVAAVSGDAERQADVVRQVL
jgi:hypothetical protein